LSKFTGGSNITEDIFVDTCILAGTPFMKTLPILEAPNRADLLKPHSAVKMIMGTGQSGYSVVVSNQDLPSSGKEYVIRYQKARLAVKNHPIYTEEGKIEPLNSSSMPMDAVQYLGQRLPDEMLHYMAKGLINPRILQWRTTCEIFEVPPMDGGESSEYRNLVSSKIIPLRTLAMSLLSSTLFNWYRYNDLKQTYWFSAEKPTTVHVEKPSEAQTPSIVDTWNVKEATFKAVIAQHKVSNLIICFHSDSNINYRTADSSALPFYRCRTPTLFPRLSLRRILRTYFLPTPKFSTTQYGDSLLYESMWMEATT
jgi:hypothetical protein